MGRRESHFGRRASFRSATPQEVRGGGVMGASSSRDRMFSGSPSLDTSSTSSRRASAYGSTSYSVGGAEARQDHHMRQVTRLTTRISLSKIATIVSLFLFGAVAACDSIMGSSYFQNLQHVQEGFAPPPVKP